MPDLASVFRQAVATAGFVQPGSVLDDPHLEDRLAMACNRGQAAFPHLALDPEAFVRHLGRCLLDSEGAPPLLEELAVEDLFLACACLAGIPGAAEAFDARCGAQIRGALSTLPDSAIDREDVEQQLRIRLLTGTEDAPPRLRGYLGHGPLARWAGVAAQRLAVSALRSNQSEATARERSAVEAAFDWKDPDVLLLKERYRPDFQRALEDAMGIVSDRDRLLLRLHLVNGMTTRSLGKMYNVDHSTAARWLADARQRIADHVQRLLRERLNLSPSEIHSIATLMASQLDFSISLLLQHGR